MLVEEYMGSLRIRTLLVEHLSLACLDMLHFNDIVLLCAGEAGQTAGGDEETADQTSGAREAKEERRGQ